MKKILLLLFGFAFLAIGCNRDDDNPKKMLEGSWKPVKYIDKVSLSGSTPTTNTYVPTSCEQQSRINFNSNNNGTYTEYDLASGGACGVVDSGNFTYNYDDSAKKLTITSPDGTDIFTVKTLSSNELVVELSSSGNVGGQTYSYTEETYYSKVN